MFRLEIKEWLIRKEPQIPHSKSERHSGRKRPQKIILHIRAAERNRNEKDDKKKACRFQESACCSLVYGFAGMHW